MRHLKNTTNLIFGLIFLSLLVLLFSGCAGNSGAAQSSTGIPEGQIGPADSTSLDSGLGTTNGVCRVDNSGCDSTATLAPETALSPTMEETNEAPNQGLIEITPTTTLEPQPKPTLGLEDWKDLPVIPISISDRVREIYRLGLEQGNDPKRFSKIGDCQNINTYFLAIYDDPTAFTLGEKYDHLQGTIDYYNGMWSRDSISVKNGFNVANIFNPWFNNKELCDSNETPIDCELRINKPSVVLISMEAWWNGDPARYATYYRRIVETVLSYNAVPILATKADNLEGNNEINRSIVQIAYEYDVPVWNFWRAVQDIPKKGLEEDGFHITHGLNDFSDPDNLERAWPVRNLTALQAIDAVRLALQQP